MRDEGGEGERWLRHAAGNAQEPMAYGASERLVIGDSPLSLVNLLKGRFPVLKGLRDCSGILDQHCDLTSHPNGVAAACRSRGSGSGRRGRRSRGRPSS